MNTRLEIETEFTDHVYDAVSTFAGKIDELVHEAQLCYPSTPRLAERVVLDLVHRYIREELSGE